MLLDQFQQAVSPGNLRLVFREGVPGDAGFLLLPRNAPRRFINPLRDRPGLFLSFADIRPEPENVWRFADKFGFLRSPHPQSALVSESPLVQDVKSPWLRTIEDMRNAVFVWRKLSENGARAMSKYIERSEKKISVVLSGKSYPLELVELPEVVTAKLSSSKQVALLFLQQITNSYLVEVVYRLLWDHSASRLNIYPVPDSLCAALWFQFARALEGTLDTTGLAPQFIRCEFCRDWVAIGSRKSKRSDTRFCTANCRIKHYRQAEKEKRK